MTEKEYRELDAVSYSLLSALAKDPKNIRDKKDKKNEGMVLGSIVDSILLTGDFDERFYVGEISKPTSTVEELLDWILEQDVDWSDKDKFAENLLNTIKEGLTHIPYRKSNKEAVRYSKAEEAIRPYLKSLGEAGDKHVISEEDHRSAKEVVNGFKTNEFTKKFFENPQTNKVKRYKSLAISWTHHSEQWNQDVPVKNLFDEVVIVPSAKKVVICDVKTIGKPIYQFLKDYWYYNYYIQDSLYTTGMRNIANGNGKIHFREDQEPVDISGFEVSNMKFLVGSFVEPSLPLVFPSSDELVEFGAKGGKRPNGTYKYPGWIQLIDDLIWHKKENKWDRSREIYNNKGRVNLEL